MLNGRMYYVDGAVRSAGNNLQNVVADHNAAVYQILWRFVVETSMDCYTKLVPDSVCHIEYNDNMLIVE